MEKQLNQDNSMSFFDSDWIVEYEYSDGFLSTNKKSNKVIRASSEYDAKSKAEAILKQQYRYVWIRSVTSKRVNNYGRGKSVQLTPNQLKQRAIIKQERYIKKVKKLPLIKGLMSAGITLADFLINLISIGGKTYLLWVPFVLLGIGSIITVIVVIIYIKIRPKRLKAALIKLEILKIK